MRDGLIDGVGACGHWTHDGPTVTTMLDYSCMPVRSVIHKQKQLVVTIEEGRVTFCDMLANHDRLLSDPDFNPEFNQLSDATLATDTDLSASNARTLYDRKVFSPTARRAVVAPSEFTYGVARMLQTYIELSKYGPVVEVFRDRASALTWLGISEDLLGT